jgi:hypothetical protein
LPKTAKKLTTESKPAGLPDAAGDGLGTEKGKEAVQSESVEVESFAASGIDNALDLLEVVTAKMDKASVGQQAAAIERHPEVCSPGFCFPICTYEAWAPPPSFY